MGDETHFNAGNMRINKDRKREVNPNRNGKYQTSPTDPKFSWVCR